MIVICGIVIFTGIIGTLSLCKAAGRADRWMEEIEKEKIESGDE